MTVLLLTCCRLSTLISSFQVFKVVGSVYTIYASRNSGKHYSFLTVLLALDISHSDWDEMQFQNNFNLHVLDRGVEHFENHLLGICISFFESSVFRVFVVVAVQSICCF